MRRPLTWGSVTVELVRTACTGSAHSFRCCWLIKYTGRTIELETLNLKVIERIGGMCLVESGVGEELEL